MMEYNIPLPVLYNGDTSVFMFTPVKCSIDEKAPYSTASLEILTEEYLVAKQRIADSDLWLIRLYRPTSDSNAGLFKVSRIEQDRDTTTLSLEHVLSLLGNEILNAGDGYGEVEYPEETDYTVNQNKTIDDSGKYVDSTGGVYAASKSYYRHVSKIELVIKSGFEVKLFFYDRKNQSTYRTATAWRSGEVTISWTKHDAKWFRVVVRGANGAVLPSGYQEAVEIWQDVKAVEPYTVNWAGTTQSILQRVLGCQISRVDGVQPWTLGSIPSAIASKQIDPHINYDVILDFLQRQLAEWNETTGSNGYHFVTNTTSLPWTINVVQDSTTVAGIGRLSRNLYSARISTDYTQIQSKLQTVKYGVVPSGFTPSTTGTHFYRSRTFTPSEDEEALCLKEAQEQINANSAAKRTITLDAQVFEQITGISYDRLVMDDLYQLELDDGSTGEIFTGRVIEIGWQDVYGSPGRASVTLSNVKQDASGLISGIRRTIKDMLRYSVSVSGQ